jgi:hypothetical protein
VIWACIGDSLLCAVELERSGSGVDHRDDACKLLKLWATEAALALVQVGRGAFLLVGRERQVSLWLLLTWRFVQQAPPTCSFHDLGMSKQNLLQLFNTTPHQSAWLTQCRPVACLASACRTEAAVPQSSSAVGLLSPDSLRSTMDSITASAAARGSPHRSLCAHQQRMSSARSSDALVYQTFQTISVIMKQWTKPSLIQILVSRCMV